MDQFEQMELFYEIFDESMPRLGPGDDSSTERALETILRDMKERGAQGGDRIEILDMGCGLGAQALVLARNEAARILALDNHQPYLDELDRRAADAGLSERIKTCTLDMSDVGPDLGLFDIVWSEGALYVIGFDEGLGRCRGLLKPGGYCAVTELAWFLPDPPEECASFFGEEYPAMGDVAANLKAIDRAGFELLDHFKLPDSSWWDLYYNPFERRLKELGSSWAGDEGRAELLDRVGTEVEMCRKYQSYYGYVFYVMRSPDGT